MSKAAAAILELPPLAQLALDTGREIKAMRPAILADRDHHIEIKPDNSPVTSADIYAHNMIAERLAGLYPDIPLVSEEGDKEVTKKALKAPVYFATDPLDNTGGFINAAIPAGQNGYSVNIGKIEHGKPTEGAIYFPDLDELYFTGKDGKAYLKEGENPPRQIKVRGVPQAPLDVAVGFSEQKVAYLGDTISANLHQRPGQYRTCMVASGQVDVTGINQGAPAGFDSWDTAGPHAVLLAAGGEIVTTQGEPLRYGTTTELPHHIAGSREAINFLKQQQLLPGELIKEGRKIS